MYCPKIKDYFVSGNAASDNFTYIGINLQKWNLDSGWKSSPEVLKYSQNLLMGLLVVLIDILNNLYLKQFSII